ncbi:predicted protein [Uncinocarpus reesii 1704]|uniref:non-specific serine/threonine protein kinase n=1 Tax=Uncinocarpus reesii (strain UAMH 1704) TaxID=336963 RepID=C4JPL2_UNCRE|nr:uncharacterized protein UREG_03184 [Uncinocarpus reesii 1704]EEP78338.1 predicted protein [Uncinocarpus reesii 1704]
MAVLFPDLTQERCLLPFTTRWLRAVAPAIWHLSRPSFRDRFRFSPAVQLVQRNFSSSSSTVPPSKETENQNAFDYEYDWIDGAESLERYRPGGYHPIVIDDVLHDRYQVVDKLGFGGYSTTWLAWDLRLQKYAAVKVRSAGSPSNEARVLRVLSSSLGSTSPSSSIHSSSEIRGLDSVPTPLDKFKLQGPNGSHPCYTMVLAQCNLKDASYSRLFPLDVARALSAGLTLAVAYVHSQGYIHGDIHLRNVLAKAAPNINELSIKQFYQKYGEPETVPITERHGKPLPPNAPKQAVIPLYLGKYAEDFSVADTHVLLSDFGAATPASNPKPGKDCHSPLPTRPPEARFEPQKPLSPAADI